MRVLVRHSSNQFTYLLSVIVVGGSDVNYVVIFIWCESKIFGCITLVFFNFYIMFTSVERVLQLF